MIYEGIKGSNPRSDQLDDHDNLVLDNGLGLV